MRFKYEYRKATHSGRSEFKKIITLFNATLVNFKQSIHRHLDAKTFKRDCKQTYRKLALVFPRRIDITSQAMLIHPLLVTPQACLSP